MPAFPRSDGGGFSRLLTRTATVVPVNAGPALDEYGNLVEVAGAGVNYPAWLEQTAGDERTEDRDTQLADWLLVLPVGAVIDGNDRVQVEGKTFEVVGPPARVHTPRGEHHVEARLRSVDG